jgi:hypothetical protein
MDSRQSRLAESDMTWALAKSFSSYFCSSFDLTRNLIGCACDYNQLVPVNGQNQTNLHKDRYQLLWIGIRKRCNGLEAIVVKDPGCPTFDEGDFSESQQICLGSGREPVREMI